MAEITELRVALTVAEFDEALACYAMRSGCGNRELELGRRPRRTLEAGRATLELMDEAHGRSRSRTYRQFDEVQMPVELPGWFRPAMRGLPRSPARLRVRYAPPCVAL